MAFWGVHVDGDDITWDDVANAAIPMQAGLGARHSGKVLQVTTGTDGIRNGAPVRRHLWANEDHKKFRLDPLVRPPPPSGSRDGDRAASALLPRTSTHSIARQCRREGRRGSV
ncbi:hypothetical protein [Streptomyces sp. NPDC057939]|uniref:hypothetical protein n=1 Tax=Streptomyces sp. NPDC057939 TaxID=3346284 RepID=UPI0036E5D8FE